MDFALTCKLLFPKQIRILQVFCHETILIVNEIVCALVCRCTNIELKPEICEGEKSLAWSQRKLMRNNPCNHISNDSVIGANKPIAAWKSFPDILQSRSIFSSGTKCKQLQELNCSDVDIQCCVMSWA